MEKDNIITLQQFIKMQKDRSQIQLKGTIEAQMDYLEYVIRTQFDKNSKQTFKFKKRKAELEEQFIYAINQINRQEKVAYYQQFLNIIKNVDKQQYQPKINKQVLTNQCYIRSLNLKMWKKKKIRLDSQSQILYAQKSNKINHYNLGNYLVRTSKNKDYHCFVLEAINSFPHQKSRTVHFGFIEFNLYQIWVKAISQSIHIKNWQYIKNLMAKENMSNSLIYQTKSQLMHKTPEKQSLHNRQFIDQIKPQADSSDQETPQKQSIRMNKMKLQQSIDKKISPHKKQIHQQITFNEDLTKFNTIIDGLLESDNDERIQEILQSERKYKKQFKQQKKHLDLFHKIMPQYQLEHLQQDYDYLPFLDYPNFRVIHHENKFNNFKVQINFQTNIKKEIILAAITNTHFFVRLNNNVQQFAIKTMIASENSAIIYQKNKAYNKLYRCRDFIFLRHVFANDGDLYVIDKSLQNSQYPPFLTIVRGKICILWGILNRKGKTSLIIQIQQTNEGYLNQLQQINLTMQYIQGLKNMEQSIKVETDRLLKFKIFDIGWDITKNEKNKVSNQIRKRKMSQKNLINQSEVNSQKFKQQQSMDFTSPRFNANNISHQSALLQEQKIMEVVGEIDLKQIQQNQKLKTVLTVVNTVDTQGYVIISQQYAKTKFRVIPKNNVQYDFQQPIIDHPIWKGQWLHDDEQGGVIFTNQKKVDSQKGVLTFILTKMGKNLLSGKGIMNISLPVDIFGPQSNLQRLLYSMTYAPLLLQKVCHKSPFERLKQAVIFGITNSPLYLSMEKPFNPILGQTFQCWINGCPAYAQQISHHPPIAALLMIGRGYTISAQLQSKIEVSFNSGCGLNDGLYRLRFDDGMQICFNTGGGQLTGLTYGTRKFNISGKSYYWIEDHNLVVEVMFNPMKKGFFSIGKQQMPSDYFQGHIYEVTNEFMAKFKNKRKTPQQKDVVKDLGKLHGIWSQCYYFDNEIIFDIKMQYPLKLEYEPHPLPSDSNWRQDIHYRRVREITRAQTEKQRMENLQREDRKLRQKGKKK